MDISIKNLKKYIFEPKTESLRRSRAQAIVSSNMVITEKVDGTKLTLVRTSAPYSADYTKNWIVSYKGAILSAGEFSHLSNDDVDDISKSSVGIGQYALVFQHLKRINDRIADIPAGTEFSVEFVQNKDTLTRTYTNKGGMFLRSYGQVKYRVVSGELHTSVVGDEITDNALVAKMAKVLEISSFPVLHSGNLSEENLSKNPLVAAKMTNVDWTNPLEVVTKFSAAILSVPSSLGGKSEGVVLKLSSGEFFKLVQDDQYDSEVRDAKKELYRLDPDTATAYFQQIRALIQSVFSEIGTDGKTQDDVVTGTNTYINKHLGELKKFFDSLQKIAGGKKNLVQIKDDVHDTVRLLASKRVLLGTGSTTLGLIPIAGKPLHIGHWKLIEKAAKENDTVVVYTSSSDRIKKGEFPIKGDDFVQLWSDIFIPHLPKNVRVKFVDSPVRSVMHELGWLEQTVVQDQAKVPVVSLYSDKDDVEVNFKDEDLKKYPSLLASGKIKKVGVERSSTVNVSGTKMREFLMIGDKSSFFKYLPPVSEKEKTEIWDMLIARKSELKEISPYSALAETLINEAYPVLMFEGGWRNADTQGYEVTPKTVAALVFAMDEFLSAFNSWSGLPAVKTRGPVGSGKYYKADMNDPSIVYGDVDMQIVLPVESNHRTDQLEANKIYGDAIRTFVSEKKPSYIHPALDDAEFGSSYLIFNVDGKKVQVDLVLSYTISADWTDIRTTPERGLKGFVTGLLLSALSETLNVVLGSSTNPYINTVRGKPVSSQIKKDAEQIFLNPSEVFLDILDFYGKLAGVRNINRAPLAGHYGLHPEDPSLKRKCETVVALANALEANGIFSAKVITTKEGELIPTRAKFIERVLGNFITSMEKAKTAKKLDRAETPSAMKTVEKIKKHADLGTEIAKQLIKEEIELLNESGQSIAAVDHKTPKTVNGKPAQATTKLKIVDEKGNDIHSAVSTDVKELVHSLNSKVGFWKKNSPYIENGFVFNGSSQFLMDPAKFGVLSKYKSAFGDIDVIVPKQRLDALESYLDSIDDNRPEWTPTPANKISKNFYYVGRTKNARALAEQTVTLWYYVPVKQVVQIDFEGDDMVLDKQGFEKPSEWNKFIKDSPWADLESGIKGLAGAILLRGLTRAATALPNAVVVTNKAAEAIEAGLTDGLFTKSKTDKKGNVTPGKSLVSNNATHALPAQYTLNTSGAGHPGVRKAYRLVAKDVPYDGKPVNIYTDISASESNPEDRITSVSKVFELIFKRKPTATDIQNFRSYKGLLTLMKALPKETQRLALARAKEGLDQAGLNDTDLAPIRKAAQDILGISI